MLKHILIFIFCAAPVTLYAQISSDHPKNKNVIDTANKTDLIDIGRDVFKIQSQRTPDTAGKRIYFSILPVSSADAGPNRMLLTSTTAGFYLGSPRTTYLSNVNFTPYLNFSGRYGLPIRSNIWLKNNMFNIQGDTRYMVYPQYTWGLGAGQPDDQKFLVDYKYLRVYQSIVKRVTSYLYLGIGINLDYYFNIDSDGGAKMSFRQFTNYNYGTTANGSSFSLGPTFNVLYDSRNNSLNPLPGWYGNFIYRLNYQALGSTDNWRSLYIDVRKYEKLSDGPKKNMVAFWAYYWTTLTQRTPYLNLPAIGMEPGQRSGRGILQNRYRGESLVYLEVEYRRDITRNGLLGFVVFANASSASEVNSRKFKYINPAAGAGMRIKFNKASDTNIGLDYGISRGQRMFMLSVGEAF
ncbi:BamA/TamA family outer membrane protein [Mucilaginibacter auburnensis]|uniref:Surface antigen-like protein n=1 Tax=Mucilaginibacter auburnensis TaxID=1457233 RepID=A0A2H9VUU9_9SPHI|nr:BamA/TamA family outer membrane protein [Mucilaginibacter auburnensis]PJJ84595.1 surface antigen-like protein [Mucilaginibacter auburnensis]